MLRSAGVALEGQPVHLPGLALVPVGAVVDGDPAGDGEGVVGDVDLEHQVVVGGGVHHPGEDLEAGLAAGDARDDLGVGVLRRGHPVVLVATVGRRQPVDGREEVEPAAPEVVAGDLAGGAPGLGGDPDGELHAGVDDRLDQGVAQLGGQAVADRLAARVGFDLGGVGLGRVGLRRGGSGVSRHGLAPLRRRGSARPSTARPGPRCGCAPAGGRCPRAGPRAGAGSPARRRRRG